MGGRARLGAGAVAGVAGGVARDVHRRGDALHRPCERELQLGFEVSAALRARTSWLTSTTAPEQVAEQVAEPAEVVSAEREAAGSTAAAHRAHGTHAPHLVVLLALLLVP